jgi:hypothetical protein
MISIVFSTPISKWNLLSFFIRLLLGTPYSHVSLRIDNKWLGRVIYFESRGLVTHFTSEKDFLAKESIINRFDIYCTEQNTKEFLDFCFDNLNVGYAIFDLITIPIIMLLNKCGIKINSIITYGKTKEICSKVVALALNSVAGCVIKSNTDDCTPYDVYNFLSQWPPAIKVI